MPWNSVTQGGLGEDINPYFKEVFLLFKVVGFSFVSSLDLLGKVNILKRVR